MWPLKGRIGNLLRARPGSKPRDEPRDKSIERARLDAEFAEIMLDLGFRHPSLTRMHYRACFVLDKLGDPLE